MGQGLVQRRLLERCWRSQACAEGPVVPASPHPPVTQQELAEPMTGPGPVDHHVGPGPAQVPDRFLGRRGHPHRRELAGPEQHRQPAGVPLVGLDPSPGRPGSTTGRSPRSASRPAAHSGQLVTGRTRLVTRPHPLRVPNRPISRRTDSSSALILSTTGIVEPGSSTPAEIVFLCTSIAKTHTSGGTWITRPAPSVCGSVRLMVDNPRKMRNGPAVPCSLSPECWPPAECWRAGFPAFRTRVPPTLGWLRRGRGRR